MKWGDFLIIGILISIAVFFFLNNHKNSTHLYLLVKTETEQKTYSLNHYKIITNYGPLGKSILVITNRTVFMKSSPCPQQICVKEGAIKKPKQSIFCIPNKIEATILSSNGSKMDAITR